VKKAWVGEEETPRQKQKSEEGAAMTKNLVGKVDEHKHRESGLIKRRRDPINNKEMMGGEKEKTHQLTSMTRDRDPVRTISFGNQIEQEQAIGSELVQWEVRDGRDKGMGLREE
jgi:hypothetical protein